jgi:nucleoside-diphosphate-sugar epimerase
VTAESRPVRRRRSRAAVVAVTGAADGLAPGLAPGFAGELAERLAGRSDVRKVIGLDLGRGPLAGVTWRPADVRDPLFAKRLGGVDVLVHLAVDQRVDAAPEERTPLTVRGTAVALAAAVAAGVRRVVLVTSAMAYGALDDNPCPLDEDAPLRATPVGSLVADLLEVERLAAATRQAHPHLELAVLRPAVLCGPGVDTVLTRHFEAPRLLVLKGSTPRWQFCHRDDLLAALVVAVTAPAAALGSGVLTVGSEGWLEQDEVERVSGLRRIELPPAVAFGTADRLYRLGLSPAPASDLAYVVHPWQVSCARLRAAGWSPAYDNAAALRDHLDHAGGQHALAARRLDRRDATRAAAGATVALVGTAALVRQARRRRRG